MFKTIRKWLGIKNPESYTSLDLTELTNLEKGLDMQKIILTLLEVQRLKEWAKTLIYIQADDWDYIDEILAAKINALHNSNWEN